MTTQIKGNATSTFGGNIDVTGNVVTDAPAFHAYQSTQQTGISNAVFTKVNLQTEDFDTDNCFDNVTNYRFTPTVAGYYQINATAQGVNAASSVGSSFLSIYKNGSRHRESVINTATTAGIARTFPSVSGLVYANGTTDYFELYVYADGMPSTYSLNSSTATHRTTFSAVLVRAV